MYPKLWWPNFEWCWLIVVSVNTRTYLCECMNLLFLFCELKCSLNVCCDVCGCGLHNFLWNQLGGGVTYTAGNLIFLWGNSWASFGVRTGHRMRSAGEMLTLHFLHVLCIQVYVAQHVNWRSYVQIMVVFTWQMQFAIYLFTFFFPPQICICCTFSLSTRNKTGLLAVGRPLSMDWCETLFPLMVL